MDLKGKFPIPLEGLDRDRAEACGGVIIGRSAFFSPEDLAKYRATLILDPNVAKAIERQTKPCAGCGG